MNSLSLLITYNFDINISFDNTQDIESLLNVTNLFNMLSFGSTFVLFQFNSFCQMSKRQEYQSKSQEKTILFVLSGSNNT